MVHIGGVTVGVVVGTELSYLSAFLIVVAHGLCSPLLFGAVYHFYEGRHSRLLVANRGGYTAPLATLTLFLLLAANMGVPPFLNLWSEVLMFCSLLPYATHTLWFLMPTAFLAAVYHLHLYVRLTHGKETASVGPRVELWSRGHALGLLLSLACGLAAFNGSYRGSQVQFPLRLLCVDFLNLVI